MRLACPASGLVFGLYALALAACQPETPAETAPAKLPNGSTLSYIRSNQNGTMPEHIYVHVVSPTEVHVTKMVERCTDAAYVTAQFDAASGEATRLVGGRLQKDGTQLPQAFLTLDPAARRIDIRLGDPASAPSETHDAPPAPWRMYDFDFAEFALFGPREPKDFSFGLALAWPDTAPPLVSILGDAKAEFLGAATHDGKPANRFRLSGAAFADKGGEALFDASQGYLVEANFARPNHAEYKDFRMKLENVATDTGDAAWREVIATHWKDC